MSLWSYISGNSSNQAGSSYINSTVSAALAKIGSTSGATKDAATPASSDTGVSISANAQAAASEADDNKKDFADLAKEIRSSLDTLYAAEKAAGKPKTANFANLSGRALSAVVLDQGNQFTPAERHQAKAALDQQTRAAFVSATSGGMSMSSLSSYSQSLVAQYDAMSPEERQARGWTQSFRDNAAKVVSEGSLSLFDQIDN
ncbi:MAG: hypothetical protein JF628_03685 [Sphingomonas sp.]|nr:hypothetical protein [Sphingomonas sp.]